MTRREIIETCRAYGARSPEFVFWIVKTALFEGVDSEIVFEQLRRNQPQLFFSNRPRPAAGPHRSLNA
jgi:hypothetical protein